MLAFSADLSARPAASRFLHPSTQIPPSTIITLRLTTPRILSPHPPSALNSAHYRNLQSLKKQKTTTDGNGEGDPDDDADEDLCPVDCVKEFRTNAELSAHLEAAKLTDSLVVVDFYRTACGSCKYIEQGFVKLCKGAGDHADAVIFLKHNVMDEYEEQSEVAESLKIRVVPLFHFYKDGKLLESFATRERTKIDETIEKYLYPKDTPSTGT